MKVTPITWLRAGIFILALMPAAQLVVGVFTDDLTANPIEFITRQTGFWTLGLLAASLAVTPIRRLTGWNEVIRLRRLLGLFAFFYGTLHLLVWIVLDKFFDWQMMIEDITKRRFITIGMLTWVLLLPLALTSTQAMIRRLGRRWQKLHRLVYVAAVTGVIHYWWLVKADLFWPQLFALGMSILFAFRLGWRWRERRHKVVAYG